MSISSRGSKMWVRTFLENIDDLAEELETDIDELSYHLHTKWALDEDYAIGADCGPDYTGGHYDPYFTCGPATAVSDEICSAIYGEDPNYTCSTAYADSEYAECEVGDLSGKYGALTVLDGKAADSPPGDPVAALDYQYVDRNSDSDDPEIFASVVFHNAVAGAPRVLCGRLVRD